MSDLKDFECVKCGNCCIISGYVRITDSEIDAIASFLNIPEEIFIGTYTILTEDRRSLSLIERQDASCIFYDKIKGCLINEVKPQQCKDFPYKWKYNNLSQICKGVNF